MSTPKIRAIRPPLRRIDEGMKARGAGKDPKLTLTLLVLGIRGADHKELPPSFDEFAVLTDPLDAGSNFHGDLLNSATQPHSAEGKQEVRRDESTRREL